MERLLHTMDPERPHLIRVTPRPFAAYPLSEGWSRVGRSAAADIRLDSPSVSRRHALIVADPGGPPRILDDRSLNGLTVNGEPVEWVALQDGDRVEIGAFRFVYLSSGSSHIPAAPKARTEQPRDPLSLGQIPRGWEEAIGPLRAESEVVLHPSSAREGSVATAARTALLIFATDETGENLYPAFQFDKNGHAFPAVEPCIQKFMATGLDPYTTAAWFVTPQQDLNGVSPAAWMRDGRADAVLVEAAGRSAALFRR